MNSSVDHYQVLGVSEDADPDQIKKAYEDLVEQFNPLNYQENFELLEKHRQINAAYDVLSKPEQRKLYDQKKRMDLNKPKMRNEHIFSSPYGIDSLDPIFFTKSSFGRGYSSMSKRMIQNIEEIVECTIQELYIGVTKRKTINYFHNGFNQQKDIFIKIPKGTNNKDKIILKGEGNVQDGFPPGDIIITIIQIPSIFERKNLDLILRIRISLKESLVGFERDIECINGTIYHYSTDKITQNEETIQKIGMGMPSKDEFRYGNMMIIFEIEYPKLEPIVKEILLELLPE